MYGYPYHIIICAVLNQGKLDISYRVRTLVIEISHSHTSIKVNVYFLCVARSRYVRYSISLDVTVRQVINP